MARRPSARFRCPTCKTVLVKSDVAQLLGQAGGYMGFGSDPVVCPVCGNRIDAQKMINGDYDEREASGPLTLLAVAWLFGGPFLLSMKFGWPLGWAIVTPWATGIALLLLAAAAVKLSR